MYKCQACAAAVSGARLVHQDRRQDGSILKETPVCARCKGLLAKGVKFNSIALVAHVGLLKETSRG